MKKNSVSIVTPIYNDSYLAEEFAQACLELDLGNYYLSEIIFIVDGSGIKDEIEIKKVCSTNPRIRALYFSRNFGQHIALSAGYKESTGDFVCMINVDQQDPPSQISKLLQYQGKHSLDIVYGLRETRKDSLIKSFTSSAFNFVLNKLTGDNTPLNVATIRIMNRAFVDAYNQLVEKSRYLPGLEFWLGFERGYVETEYHERLKGKSSYNFSKRMGMAIESIISFSDLPLRWTAISGMIMGLVGFIILLALILLKLFVLDFQHGFTSTIAAILLVGGIQIFVIGIASIYIGRVLKEVQNRPLYIIKDKINFDNV